MHGDQFENTLKRWVSWLNTETYFSNGNSFPTIQLREKL